MSQIEQSQFPSEVKIYEVGPRDGLQNESTIVPVEEKVAFINNLISAGLPIVELTSFVSPKWVPQLSDAAQVLSKLPKDVVQSMPVLVPNLKGLALAKDNSVNHIAVFASATEAFAKNNLNSTYDRQFDAIDEVVKSALADGMKIRGYVSMCFGDPWEGEVSQSAVINAVKHLIELGVYEVSLGDTIGVAVPSQVKSLIENLIGNGIAVDRLAVHFHDTYGQALSNTLMAMACGVSTIDASAGGIGGCPYAPNAAGNLATEDLLWMLHGMGISTGVDLEQVVAASSRITKILGRPSSSRVLRAISGN